MNGTTIDIRLKPRAKADRIGRAADGAIEVAVTAPPVDGRANEHLLALLADTLELPKRAIAIIKGGRCRNKTVAIAGMTKGDVIRRLCAL